jgi:NAD(P)-dependent dehydrogenase (short-subunit alcohol dehydrogenase family)
MSFDPSTLTTRLDGKVALVTGGAVRVGRVICCALASRGASVALTYLPGEPADEAAEEAASAGGCETMTVPLDVRQPMAAQTVIRQVHDRFGRIDILVNNASIWLRGPFLSITREAWQTALDVNLTGPFLMSQAVAPHMLEQESGLIINITDLSAFQTWPEYAHHSASKAGLVALTRVMAAELAPHIRVNAIAPGTVLLPDGAPDSKRQWAEENSLLKRVGHPEDVARTVLYLVDSDFATGATYLIDGGRALVSRMTE